MNNMKALPLLHGPRKKVWLILLLGFCSVLVSGQKEAISPFLLKIAYLEKFAVFVTWPKSSSVFDTTVPFVIGVVGEKKAADDLREIYSDYSIKEKKVVVRHITEMQDALKCNLLYIVKQMDDQLLKLLESLKRKPVLVVSDDRDLLKKGVHIAMMVRRQKVRYEVDQKALEDSSLGASYHLLKMAYDIVNRLKRR